MRLALFISPKEKALYYAKSFWTAMLTKQFTAGLGNTVSASMNSTSMLFSEPVTYRCLAKPPLYLATLPYTIAAPDYLSRQTLEKPNLYNYVFF